MKMFQIITEKFKNLETFQFSKVLRDFFSKFSTDFVNWYDEKCQQSKNVLSSMPITINAVFQTETVRNRHRKTKFRKVANFHYFRSIFGSKYRYTSWTRIVNG